MRKSVYLFNSGELHKENDSLVLIDKSSNKTYDLCLLLGFHQIHCKLSIQILHYNNSLA